jgi:serine/threonine protein kinase
MPAPKLRAKTKLRADDGTTYQVEAVLGQGGFGTTYTGHRLSARGNPTKKVCIKVCNSRHDWHGEAFFGELLSGNARVVGLLDAFVTATGSGAAQRRRHVLVFEFMEDGTVWDMVLAGGKPWTEARVRKELKALLKLLSCLHNAGVTHRDLKPDNVYLRDKKLILGDFGITKMDLDPTHSFASAFAPGFAPKEVLMNAKWGQADDVYQVGLLAGTLLSGDVWWTDTVSVKAIAALPASDELKSWIWHATGARTKRYWDAADAVDALEALKEISVKPSRGPRSLDGQTVVFTGRIDGLTRQAAMNLARRSGAMTQRGLTDSTSLLVVGKIKAGSAGADEGLKLFATRERLRLGQRIRVISAAQFKHLSGV